MGQEESRKFNRAGLLGIGNFRRETIEKLPKTNHLLLEAFSYYPDWRRGVPMAPCTSDYPTVPYDLYLSCPFLRVYAPGKEQGSILLQSYVRTCQLPGTGKTFSLNC